MQRILCCFVVLLGLTACESADLSLESRFSIQLPATLNYELKHLRAVQDGEELEPQELNELEFVFVLEPDVPTIINATLFEVTVNEETRLNSSTLQSESVSFISAWRALIGQTAEFSPPPGTSSQSLIMEKSDVSLEFVPVMVDSAGMEHMWQGDWSGVQITDLAFGYQLSLPLAQMVMLPAERDVELLPVHPFGEELESTVWNTAEVGPDFRVDLGDAPAPLPARVETTVQATDEAAPLDYAALYNVAPFTLECRVPTEEDLQSQTLNCDPQAEWVACSALAQAEVIPDRFTVYIRYSELPSLGCGELIVNREILIEPDTQVWRIGDLDEQFLEAGPNGWESDLTFYVSANLENTPLNIAPAGVPVLGALDTADGTENVNPITGVTCGWGEEESPSLLKVVCTGESGPINDAFSNSIAVLEAKFTADSLGSREYLATERFRVLGLPATTNVPTILSTMPAYGALAKKAQLAVYWVQVGIQRRSIEIGQAELKLSGQFLAREPGGDPEQDLVVGQTDQESVVFMNWDEDNDGTNTRWVEVRVGRTDNQGDTSALDKFSLFSLRSDSFVEVDTLEEPIELRDSPLTFLRQDDSQTLRFSADFQRFGVSQTFQWPISGLGLNRGGYVLNHEIGDPECVVSLEPFDDPVVPLGASPGLYDVSVGNFVDYSTNGTDYLDSGEMDSIQVSLVHPTEPASLAFNKLSVGDQVMDLDLEVLGELQRLLWDPLSENLVVVGRDAIELFRIQNTGEGSNGAGPSGEQLWQSIGVIRPSELGDGCAGPIADAALRVYSNGILHSLIPQPQDAPLQWSSQIAFLTDSYLAGGQTSVPAKHCWLDLEGLDNTETVQAVSEAALGSFAMSELSLGDCSATFNDYYNNVLGYNALSDTFWAMSGSCVVGYRTRGIGDSDGNEGPFGLVEQFNTIGQMGVNPSRFTIEPHSGVGVMRGRASSGTVFQRLKLSSNVMIEPSAGEVYYDRDLILHDPVRNWNWEVTNFVDYLSDENDKTYLWLPMVGSPDFLNINEAVFPAGSQIGRDVGVGLNHGVLDSARDLIHSLRIEGPGTANRVIRETQIIRENGNNIGTSELFSVVHEGESSLGSGGWFETDPVIDIIMVGPQITGTLPHTIRPGDYVTLLGQNFSGDERDQVCIQGICVTPEWSTPTTMSFRVPEVFQNLDVPIEAFVTVDNGTFMSGPAPGKSEVARRKWDWGSHWGNPTWKAAYPLACSQAGTPCAHGSIYQGGDGVYAHAQSGNGEVAGHRLVGTIGNWDNNLISHYGFSHSLPASHVPSHTPSGRNTNLVYGITQDNEPLLTEVRLTTPLNAQASMAASAYFSDYLAESQENSVGDRAVSTMNQSLDSVPTKILLSADQSTVGYYGANAAGEGSGLLVSGRQLSLFGTSASDDGSTTDTEPLPGRGGSVTVRNTDSTTVQAQSRLGQPTFDWNMGQECFWPLDGDSKIFGATGSTSMIGVAILGDSPLHLGLASVNEGPAGGWEKNCTTKLYDTGLPNSDGATRVTASANGEFLAIGFGSDDSYFLKVWRVKDWTEISAKNLPSIPLDMEFSDSGDELYVLLGNSLKVLGIKRDPFR